MDEEGELPAPFVYDKHKWAFLKEANKPDNEILELSQEVEDDEDIIEQELQKMRTLSNKSSVESLIGEAPIIDNFNIQQNQKWLEDEDGELSDLEVPDIIRGTRTGRLD